MRWPWQHKIKTEILSPLTGYNRWAVSYHQEHNPIKDLSNQLIETSMPEVRNKVVLDAGCGTGYFCQILERLGASRIVGIDMSPAMIERAKQNCPITEFHCADLTSYSFEPDSFDVVLCALVLGHIKEYEPLLAGLISSLRKGGTLLISDFHPYLTMHQAKRTFKDHQGKVFEVEHHLHLLEDILQCLKQNNLVLKDLKEPRWNELPVIYGIQATKV